MRTLITALLVLGGAAVSVGACGTSPVGVDACRSIESARCQWATACGISLEVPVRRSDSTNGVDDCIRYYNDACLHGIVAPTDPGSTATNACVDAINAGDCTIVRNPEKSPACAWLLATAPDAAVADTSVAPDATSD
jgi:hypothetical protein